MKRSLWVAPAVFLLAAFSVYPLFYAVRVSFTGSAGAFTLSHYTRLASDQFWHAALLQTGLYCAAALAAELVLGVGLALLVDSLGRPRGAVRLGLLAPMLLPPVVAAVIWRLIYNPQFGVLNGTLKQAGIDASAFVWTSGQTSALWSVVAVDVWEWTPFVFLVVSAGLQSLPHEPFEAARLDGATWWQIRRDITLPLLKPAIAVALLVRALDLIRVFDQIFILTQGGPGYATETVSLYIYRTAFRFQNFGYAAAMSFVMLAAATLFAKAALRLLKKTA